MPYKKNHKLRKPGGEYSVGCTRFEYEYDSKAKKSKRRIPCLCFYPSDAKDGLGSPKKYISDILMPGAGEILTNSYWDIPILPGKHPFILYSHGLGSTLKENTVQCEELASNGYIVLSIGHECSGVYEMENGDILRWDSAKYLEQIKSTQSQSEIYRKWFEKNAGIAPIEEQVRRYQAHIGLHSYFATLTDVWLEDSLAALEIFLNGDGKENAKIRACVDRDKIGAMGMSFGGFMSLRLAFESDLIKAGVNLDGNYWLGEWPETIDTPIMFMHRNDSKHLGERLFPLLNTTGDFYAVKVNNSTHPNFTDYSEIYVEDECAGNKVLGDINPDIMEQIMSTLVLDFFDKYFRQKQSGYLDTGYWDEYVVISRK